MRKNTKPDHLEEMAAKALAAGMTYGKYKAMLWEQEKKDGQKKQDLGFVPKGMRLCRKCRKPFVSHRGIMFCSDECREVYQTARNLELHRARRRRLTGAYIDKEKWGVSE